MGEIALVDLEQLRALVDRVSTAAGELAEMRWPGLRSDALHGSIVSTAASRALPAERLQQVAAGLRAWAAATRLSADAFERADTAASERFAPR